MDRILRRCAYLERTMLFWHRLAQTVSADGPEVAVVIEARRFGGALALAAGLCAVSLSVMSLPAALAAGGVNVLYAGSLVNLMRHGSDRLSIRRPGTSFRATPAARSGSPIRSKATSGKATYSSVLTLK